MVRRAAARKRNVPSVPLAFPLSGTGFFLDLTIWGCLARFMRVGSYDVRPNAKLVRYNLNGYFHLLLVATEDIAENSEIRIDLESCGWGDSSKQLECRVQKHPSPMCILDSPPSQPQQPEPIAIDLSDDKDEGCNIPQEDQEENREEAPFELRSAETQQQQASSSARCSAGMLPPPRLTRAGIRKQAQVQIAAATKEPPTRAGLYLMKRKVYKNSEGANPEETAHSPDIGDDQAHESSGSKYVYYKDDELFDIPVSDPAPNLPYLEILEMALDITIIEESE